MIVEGIFNAIFLVIDLIVTMIPSLTGLNIASGLGGLGTLLAYGLFFFPIDLWVALLTNIALWLGFQGAWSIVEWVYKKIPGVD